MQNFQIKNKVTNEMATVDFEGIDGAWYLMGFKTLNNGEDVIDWREQKDWQIVKHDNHDIFKCTLACI